MAEAPPIDSEKRLEGFEAVTTTAIAEVPSIIELIDADEAREFLISKIELVPEANAILEDSQQLRKLIRKIDLTMTPLLAAVYFLQFLDKTTLQYTAVMGIREDTHLKGQDYSVVSLLFYLGTSIEPVS